MKSNKSLKYFRAKDPVLAAILALGMSVTLPLTVRAQVAASWEEVGPSTESAQQLMAAPPNLTALSAQARPPVELPDTVEDVTDQIPENVINESPEESEVSADAGYYGIQGGTYTIQRGDTLGKIARSVLGSSGKWRELAAANPHLDPNKLNVGDTIIIPGSQPSYSATTYTQPNFVSSVPIDSGSVTYQPTVNTAETVYQPVIQQTPAEISAPSFDQTALMAPPPVYSVPNYSTPVYSSGGAPVVAAVPTVPTAPITPVTPVTSVAPNNLGIPVYQTAAPQACEVIPPGIPPSPAESVAPPVAVNTRELYREEKYRIPDELKPTDFLPYFNNMNGYYGLMEVESALLPYIPTWDLSFHLRHSKYQYYRGDKDVVEGTELFAPVSLTYAKSKMFLGVTVPFQNWEVSQGGGGDKVKLSGIHDPSVKLGYQVWKNIEGSSAVTVHAEARFSGGNYHTPYFTTSGGIPVSGKNKDNSVIGPARATRGDWFGVGGAYTGKLDDRWTNHLNLNFANDSKDSLMEMTLRLGTDYRVNHNMSAFGELVASRFESDNVAINNGKSGTNANINLGLILFNDQWQATLGFPVSIQREFEFCYDFGVTLGLNARWD